MSVNVPNARDIGEKILCIMKDKRVKEMSFKKKNQVVTMNSHNVIKIRDDSVQIDPLLLFQRLVTAGMHQEMIGEVFTYELCSHPPAIFESKYIPLPADKPVLADALWKLMPANMSQSVQGDIFVLDGGALLHRVVWTRMCSL